MTEPRGGTQGPEGGRASHPLRRSTDRVPATDVASRRSGRRLSDDAERQRAEARYAAELKYRAFFENLRELVFLLEAVNDGQGAVVDWIFREINATALEAIGWERDNVVGRRLGDVFVPEEAQTILARCETVLSTGEPFQDEVSLRGRDFLRSVFRLDDNTVASAGTDITERKRLEQTLRESEMRFRTLADSAALLIWSTDVNDRVEFLNRPALEFFAVDLAQVIEIDWHAVLHPDDVASYTFGFRAAAGARRSFQARVRVRRADGQWRWMEARANPRTDSAGRLLGYTGCAVDITEVIQTHEALREADRRKDEFLATLAHELRNPIAAVSYSLDILKASSGANTTTAGACEMMERKLDHMVRLVEDLLEVSRIMRGEIELRKEPVDLTQVIKDAVEMSKPLIAAAGHELTVSLPAETVRLHADPVRLAQVFANLLDNAAKYTEGKGHIGLTAKREGAGVAVSVRDTGIGIAEEMLSRVFDVFAQLDLSRRHRGRGLGIGLTLVRKLVQLHGGRIEARSEGPGKGAEFIVHLPL
ncbi:MAG: ATP-binding protein [Sulfurifustis sp.]